LLAVGLDAPAFAQGTDDATPARRWKASAELSYTDQSGNRTLRVLTGGFKASHLQKDLFRLDASLQSRYGESDAGVIARSHFGSLAFDLRPQATVSPFVFADAEHDRFKRLDARVSAGAGAKYTLYRQTELANEASVSLALLVQHENRVATEQDPRPPSRTIGRASLRLRGSQELPTGVRFQHVSFYQPMVDQLADYLLRTENGLRVSLNQRLALSVVHQYSRTALPPEGVSPDERILRTGIIFDF
jgi:putative salt-induced outer membrane protein YdiY